MTRLILLDRDGVINYDSPDYIKDAAEWQPIPGSLESVARLKTAGYKVAVCTNQAGIGRGILTEEALLNIHAKLTAALADLGTELDALLFCPHHPDDGCFCRKPKPGMLRDAMSMLGIGPGETVYVGDSLRDIQAAQAAGCAAALVRTGKGRAAEPAARDLGVSCVADDLAALVRALLGNES
jgi:D-glycero-D-manno-heptose 1,7-bisphosphate phosphatase